MAADDVQTMWEIADVDVDPASGARPALNALTDMVRPIAEGVKASAARARAAPEDSAARKKPRLTYDDVRAAALSLKDAGLLANVAFLNRVLPLRTEEDPKPEPRAPKTEGATGAALAAAGAAPAEGAAASAAAVAAE